MGAKLTAEFIGTFWLVLGGCGSAVLSAAFFAVMFVFVCSLAARFVTARVQRLRG